MTQDKWYNPSRLLSHNAFINMVMSPRGNGKSYAGKDIAVKSYLKDGSQTVYTRRTKVEIDEVKGTYWNDISQKYPHLEFKVEGYTGYINGEEVIHFIPLSTSTNKKSASYPRVKWIMFDEYIITKTTYNRYLKNEMTLLLDLIETVGRDRNIRVILMANAVSFVNPLFSFFDIEPTPNERFQKYKNGLICIEQFTSDVFMTEKKKTPFGRLIEGTNYAKYAIENEVLEDNNEFIKDREPTKYKYLCCFKYEDFKIGVWENLESGELFCDERIDEDNVNKFAILLDELEEGYLYVKGYRNVNLRLIKIRKSKNEGNIYFCSQEIKKVMQDKILPQL